MTQLRFVTLDVFTLKAYGGNPLAVVFLPEDESAALTQSQKHTITKEFNLSETIFVHPVSGASSKRTIDIFTIECEIPFAGHPTIGAASWFLCLAPEVAAGSNVTSLVTKSGEIPISITDAATKAVSARIAHNTRIHASRFSIKDLLHYHPTVAPFFASDASFPLFSIVNGMSQTFIELPSLEALAAVTTATGGEYVPVQDGTHLDEGWKNGLICVYFFVRDVYDDVTQQKVIRTRMMLGQFEDPATGSSASGLAAYLTLTEGQAGEEHKFHVIQGVEMGRRSDIGVKTTLSKDRVIEEVILTGTAVQVSEGRIIAPDSE